MPTTEAVGVVPDFDVTSAVGSVKNIEQSTQPEVQGEPALTSNYPLGSMIRGFCHKTNQLF